MHLNPELVHRPWNVSFSQDRIIPEPTQRIDKPKTNIREEIDRSNVAISREKFQIDFERMACLHVIVIKSFVNNILFHNLL